MRARNRLVLASAAAAVLIVVGGATQPAPVTLDPPASANPRPPATPGDPDDEARPDGPSKPGKPKQPKTPAQPRQPPSIVLVLMDDVSMDLMQAMRQPAAIAREGASYDHAFVVDSLCCVSRSSLLTGQYPHQTGVRTNTANTPNSVGPIGGWEAFAAYGNERRSVNVRLQRAGYTTGYVGKYLNQYEYVPGAALPPVPPGWSSWQPIFGSAYDGWDFDTMRADADGVEIEHLAAPAAEADTATKDAAYAGTVIADRAVGFIRAHRHQKSPYFLTVAPYGTHSRVNTEGSYPGDPDFPPAFRDRPRPGRPAGNCGPVACPELDVADLAGFGDDQADNGPRYAGGRPAPDWRTNVPRLTAAGAVDSLRNRARMAQSIDRMLGRIREAIGPDTYLVVTSDNGFHLGQHGLDRGKGTPFVSDVQVPLVVSGPGVRPGVRHEVVSNLDLAATFEDLAGLRPAPYRSGESLVPTFNDPTLDRRRFTFFEHTWAPSLGVDPDAAYAGGTTDLIPSYVAVRSRSALLVRFDLDPSWEGVDPAWEFYDYTDVGWERTNTYGQPRHRDEVALLTRKLAAFDRCAGFTGDDVVPERCRRLTH